MPRRTYAQEFKEAAAKLVTEQGYSPNKAAHSLGVDRASVTGWVRRFGGDPARPAETDVAALRRDNDRLRAENKRLLMEREILKKATAFFAREQP